MGYFLFQHLVTLEMNSRIGPTVKHVYAVSTYLSIPQQLTSWVNVVVQLLQGPIKREERQEKQQHPAGFETMT